MTQSTVETDILQAIHEGALSPYGTARAQVRGSTPYVAIPIQLAQTVDIHREWESSVPTTQKPAVSLPACVTTTTFSLTTADWRTTSEMLTNPAYTVCTYGNNQSQ